MLRILISSLLFIHGLSGNAQNFEATYISAPIDSLVDKVSDAVLHNPSVTTLNNSNVPPGIMNSMEESILKQIIQQPIKQTKIIHTYTSNDSVYIESRNLDESSVNFTRFDSSASDHIHGNGVIFSTSKEFIDYSKRLLVYIRNTDSVARHLIKNLPQRQQEDLLNSCYYFLKENKTTCINTNQKDTINGWPCTILKVINKSGNEILFWVCKEVPRSINLGYNLTCFDGGIVQIVFKTRAKIFTLKNFKELDHFPFIEKNTDCSNYREKNISLVEYRLK